MGSCETVSLGTWKQGEEKHAQIDVDDAYLAQEAASSIECHVKG